MIVKSKFNEAVVNSENIGSGATARIFDLLNTRMVENEVVKIMPGAVTNSTFIEGYTQTYSTGGILDPDILSADPYCGILGVKYKLEDEISPVILKLRILSKIPINQTIHKKTVIDEKDFKKYLKNQLEKARSLWPEIIKYKGLREIDKLIESTLKRLEIDKSIFWKSLGTLGNHFIEVCKDDGDFTWVFVQAGSRNLGYKFWQYWKKQISKTRIEKDKMKKAERDIKNSDKNEKFKKEEIKNLHKSGKHTITPSRFLDNDIDISNYLQDLYFIKAYSEYNRKAIIETINKLIKELGKEKERIETVNYSLDPIDKILRAGAINASEGNKVLIKTDQGFIIGTGLGNKDWNLSAPWFINISEIDQLKEMVEIEKTINNVILKINEESNYSNL